MRPHAADSRFASLAAGHSDGLIAACFDRAFLVFSLFVDDPRTCLDLSESVFRALQINGGSTVQEFYGELVDCVRELPHKGEFLPGVAADSVLCWLLKDAADLSYVEIGAMMAMEHAQVRDRIAEVRMALLG
jgi:hypothetical protein